MPKNTKLALNICYLYNTTSHILYFSKFIPSISNVIILYIINQLNIIIVNKINNAINILSKNLCSTITVVVQNFDILIQIFPKKMNRISI